MGRSTRRYKKKQTGRRRKSTRRNTRRRRHSKGRAGKTTESNIVCDMPYANCSGAKCFSSIRDPKTKVCFCQIFNGKNVSMDNSEGCDSMKPFNRDGNKYIYSTFSPSLLEHGWKVSKLRAKDAGTGEFMPWSDCMNAKCIVHKNNPKAASCFCKEGQTNPPTDYIALMPKNSNYSNFCPGVSGARLSDYLTTRDIVKNKLKVDLPKNPEYAFPSSIDLSNEQLKIDIGGV